MQIAAYEPKDEAGCLEVFDSNVPDFFAAEDRQGFAEFLRAPNSHYFVMEHEGRVAGCGGYYVTEDGKGARLTWGMVRREWHRHGLGRFLLLFRLKEIAKAGSVLTASLDTTPAAAGFFQRQGFKVQHVAKDGYGPGVDRVTLAMKLEVCT
jgi:GNAT superfamily N-acetyltransferase